MTDAALNFRVLGPLSVQRGDESLDLGGPQRRLLLGVLLASANRMVPVDRLVDALWGDRPPPSYRVQLQGMVSDLRRRLAPGDDRSAAPIVTCPPGYLVEVSADQFDLAQFRADIELARTARADGENAQAVRLLDAALARWRGPAFTGLSWPDVEHVAAAVEELRVGALEDRIDALLADGRLAGLSAELVRLVAEHPLREAFYRQLMTVYSRIGRTADALGVYRQLRRRIVAELGVEPSRETQELHRRVLAEDPDVVTVPAGPPGGQAPASAYHQLPPDIAEFTGRRAELAAIMGATHDHRGTAGIVWAVEGMGGVGKTRLALHAAHRLVADGRYGDGELYVDLHGFSPVGEPAEPGAVLESFLRLLGVPAARIPADLAARSAVFRDRLAGRRVVIVLDNAAEEDQVAPLLPAGSTSLVIVTSRRTLAIEGARSLRLEQFTDREALDLLGSVLGEGRVAGEPAAAAELAVCCGHLPLAVALAAQRLRARPSWSVAHMVARLSEETRRLDELAVGRRAIEPVFALSYRTLNPAGRRLFRLLGIHPGHDCTAASVAALTGMDPVEADLALEALLDEHLLQQSVPGRYHLHDLLRAYAVRLGRRDAVDDRERALGDVLDWYLSVVHAASRMIRSFPVPIFREIPSTKAPVPDFDRERALGWLDAEYANVMAAVHTAAAGPHCAHALQLAHLLQPYFVRRGRGTDWITALRLAESAAERLDDSIARAYTMTELGTANITVGGTEQALELLNKGLHLHRQLGEHYGEAVTHSNLGLVLRRLGRHADAVGSYQRALELFSESGDRSRQCMTLSALSVDLHLMGRNDEAMERAHEALRLQRSLGDPSVEASLRTNLGLLCARLDRHAEAVEHTRVALALHARVRSRPGEVQALTNLCFSYARLGRHVDAVDAGRRAVDMARSFNDPETMATALNTLGEASLLAGDHAAADTSYRGALEVASAIGDATETARAESGLARAARSGC